MGKLTYSNWDYFRTFDENFVLEHCDEMPMWEIIKDPNIKQGIWEDMSIVQENEPDPGQGYRFDEFDKQIFPIDISKLGYKSPMDKAKLVDIPIVPPKLPFIHEEIQVKVHQWMIFRHLPHVMYQAAHMLNEYKIKLRNKKPAQIPSIWRYYETLPTWCRENPDITRLCYAIEVSPSKFLSTNDY